LILRIPSYRQLQFNPLPDSGCFQSRIEMNVIKMTFTLPEDLAEQFVRRVPARERS